MSTGGKLKIHPQSNIAILKELAEQLVVLAEQVQPGMEDLRSVDDNGKPGTIIEHDGVIYL